MSKVLITGGTGCLGKGIVTGLVKDDFHVVFTSTEEEKAIKFIVELKTLGLDTSKISFELAKFNAEVDIELFVQKINDKHQITHLINNARNVTNLAMADGTPSSKAMVDEYFMSCVLPYKLALGLKNTLRGIINITSMYGIVAPNKELYLDGYSSSPIHYGVSKAAQIHLTKEMAVRLASEKINVNCISYGGFEGRVDDGFMQRYGKLCPSGRMLQVSDAYPPVKFLLGAPFGTVTGHNLVVDGGWSAW